VSSIPKPQGSVDTTFALVDRLLHPYLERLETLLIDAVRSDIPLVNESAQHLIRSGGKRFRPILVMLFSGLTGGVKDNCLPLACSIELFHTATLIHDDIIDEADIRRGIESSNIRYGNHIAVLSGDYIFSRASYLLANHADESFTKRASDALTTMVVGEIMEVEGGYNFDAVETDYLQIIHCKTADLISMSCTFGAMVNSKDKQVIKAAAEFGSDLGMAFQIIDDVLDYLSTASEFGKPVVQDIREGKMTLPIIHLRDNLKGNDLEKLKTILANHVQDNDIQWLLEKMAEAKSIDYAYARAAEYSNNAKQKLAVFPDSDYKESLLSLCDYVVNRKY
jgi:heptaprenyl diphosphate synthase